jgi:hypothetical protein
VTLNEAESRYEMPVPGGRAIAAIQRRGDEVLFTHTEVPVAARGKGAASALVSGALADVRARGLKARPACSFVQRYMADHPEWSDLLP